MVRLCILPATTTSADHGPDRRPERNDGSACGTCGSGTSETPGEGRRSRPAYVVTPLEEELGGPREGGAVVSYLPGRYTSAVINRNCFVMEEGPVMKHTPAQRPSRRTVVKGLGAAAALAPVALSAPAIIRRASAADPIRVGVISPLTGAWTVYGRAHASGFELAVDEINAAGGVLGRPMEIVLADSKTEPRIVVEQANRLIRQERVDFLAGTFSSAERNAGAPVATQGNKILLYPTFYEGQESEYFPGVCNKNIFMFGPEPTQQVWPFMEYMMGQFGKKFFLIGSDYVWPQVTNLVSKRKIDELGGEVVAEVYIPFNTPQYDSVLRDIRNSGANIIFHSLTGSDTVNFRQQFVAAGMDKDFTLWTVDDEEVVTSGLGPGNSAGTYVSFDYFMSIDHPNNARRSSRPSAPSSVPTRS